MLGGDYCSSIGYSLSGESIPGLGALNDSKFSHCVITHAGNVMSIGRPLETLLLSTLQLDISSLSV